MTSRSRTTINITNSTVGVLNTDDARRLDWLDENPSRLNDVYWRMQNEDEALREAIDALSAMG